MKLSDDLVMFVRYFLIQILGKVARLLGCVGLICLIVISDFQGLFFL